MKKVRAKTNVELKELKEKLFIANSLILNIYKNYTVPFNYMLMEAYLIQNKLLFRNK